MLVAVNLNTSVSSDAANRTLIVGSGPMIARTSSCIADPCARCNSFCSTRSCIGRSGAPTDDADAGSRTNTSVVAEYRDCWAIDRAMVASGTSTAGRITNHLRRQTTEA